MNPAHSRPKTSLCIVLLLSSCAPASGQPELAPAPRPRISFQGGSPPDTLAGVGATAHNITDLVLMQDHRKIFGWISGARSFYDHVVQIKVGARSYTVTIDSENAFRWYHRVKRPTRVHVSVAGLNRAILLEPRAAPRPSAFFTFDRPHRLAEGHQHSATMLAVLTQDSERTFHNEIGAGVRESGERPLRLHLDRTELGDGELLTGMIRSRFIGARVLLTMRDSHGIRAWRTFRLAGHTRRLQIVLPGALRDHAVVDVRYLDRAGVVHADDAPIRVRPARWVIRVEATGRARDLRGGPAPSASAPI